MSNLVFSQNNPFQAHSFIVDQTYLIEHHRKYRQNYAQKSSIAYIMQQDCFEYRYRPQPPTALDLRFTDTSKALAQMVEKTNLVDLPLAE
jgi:gamma-glutamyl:cysteine ligase YbdK (ATP-grasp superfamily)